MFPGIDPVVWLVVYALVAIPPLVGLVRGRAEGRR
jgi:hypothetical protein